MPFTATDMLYAAGIGMALGSVITLVVSWRMERWVMRGLQ